MTHRSNTSYQEEGRKRYVFIEDQWYIVICSLHVTDACVGVWLLLDRQRRRSLDIIWPSCALWQSKSWSTAAARRSRRRLSGGLLSSGLCVWQHQAFSVTDWQQSAWSLWSRRLYARMYVHLSYSAALWSYEPVRPWQGTQWRRPFPASHPPSSAVRHPTSALPIDGAQTTSEDASTSPWADEVTRTQWRAGDGRRLQRCRYDWRRRTCEEEWTYQWTGTAFF